MNRGFQSQPKPAGLSRNLVTTTFRYFPPQDETNIYRQILELFPMHFVVYCFAYGANVVPADRITPTHNSIIDIVFVVNDTWGFHEKNLERNPHHYSGLKYLGASMITKVQEEYSGLVYVNTARMENITLRYGVIYASDFVWDLETWVDLYVAGRMLQPFVTLKSSRDPRIFDALEDNLVKAVHTALLMLPVKFTERQLYETIVQLSYDGDFSISPGQAKNISKSIVASQFAHFHDIYFSILLSIQLINRRLLTVEGDKITWVQSTDNEDIVYHLTELSTSAIVCLYRGFEKDHPGADAVDAIKNISLYTRDRRAKLIRECLYNVVRRSSIAQCAKGFFTTGIIKSLYYSASKFAKLTKSYFFGC